MPREVPPSQMPSLEALAAQIREHWKKHQKELYKELLAQGEEVLREESLITAQQALDYDTYLRESGMDAIQAWSLAMREVAYQKF